MEVRQIRGLGTHTALEITNAVGPVDMIAGPRYFRIPELSGRGALQQDQDHLVDIYDDVAESNKVEEPG